MNNSPICPYYGKNDDLCDVGCDYVSPHDVDMIIKFCSSQPEACNTYRQLAGQQPIQQPATQTAASVSSAASAETAAAATEAPLCEPAPLGLGALGLALLLFGLTRTGQVELGPTVLGIGLFYAALVQIFAGLAELQRQRPFGATVYTAFGLFWLSLLALLVLPAGGWGHTPQPLALASYLCLWGLFSVILFNASWPLRPLWPTLFGVMTLHFGLLGIGEALTLPLLVSLAGYLGLAAGTLALAAGLHGLLRRPRELALRNPARPLSAGPQPPL